MNMGFIMKIYADNAATTKMSRAAAYQVFGLIK